MNTDEYVGMFDSEDQLWWYISLRRVLAAVLAAEQRRAGPSSRPLRLVDVACGTGRNLTLYTEAGFNATGFDLSPDAVEFCKQRGHAQVELQNLLTCPAPAEPFNVVCVIDMLGMLNAEQRRVAYRQLGRLAKPGALLVLHSAALEGLRSSHDTVTHLDTRFRRSQFVRELTAEGEWAVERSCYRYTTMLPLLGSVKLATRLAELLGIRVPSHQRLTPGLLNAPLSAWLRLEDALTAQGVNWPVGSSVMVLARRL